MNNLSNSIYRYYTAHFEDLPFDKKLHFASRLYLWNDDSFGAEQLARLRAEVTAQDNPRAALRSVYDYGLTSVYHGSKNASELRAPYFERYPQLRTLVLVLFRLTFLETIYGLDGRETFFKLFDKSDIETLFTKLLADKEAVAILSTHAINALYLYYRVVSKDEETFQPEQFLEIGARAYDLSQPLELQLFIYLYTHCVIGESKFYARQLPKRHLATYRRMMADLEEVIGAYFESINLDNKFEFLVCCKLVGHHSSSLTDRIEAEAKLSLSSGGTFLIDRHNNNPQTANSSLDLSEHRNVLYLMAHSKSKLAR